MSEPAQQDQPEPNFEDVEVASTPARTALVKAYIHACAASLPDKLEMDFELLMEMFIFDSKLARAEIMDTAARQEKNDGRTEGS